MSEERVTLDTPEMILDVIDEANQVLGQRSHHDIHLTGSWHRGIHILVFDSHDRVLLHTRSLSPSSQILYDCSVSAHVFSGETYPVAAARNLQAQLGITGVVLKWLLQFKMHYGPSDNMISDLFECVQDIPFDPAILQTQNLQWFTLQQVESMLINEESQFFPWTRELLTWAIEKPSHLNILIAR